MEIRTFVLGPFQVSAYVFIAKDQAMIIDAPEGADQIVNFLRDRDIEPAFLVNTHGHADHICSNGLLKETWPGMTLAIARGDEPLLTDPLKNLSLMFADPLRSPPADRLLDDGDRLPLGDEEFKVIATPGHTPGGISLYSPNGPEGKGVVFTGDALFADGIGRTDFPGSSHKTLIRSIRERLLTLPPDTVIYPGHGPAGTIGEEARSNPWL